MALDLSASSAPLNHSGETGVDTTGTTITLPGDSAIAIVHLSAEGLWRRAAHDAASGSTAWAKLPAGRSLLYEVGLASDRKIGIKATTGTLDYTIEVLTPQATRAGR
jgi:hypothetical protein